MPEVQRKIRVAQVGVGGFGAYRRERMRETGLFELVAAYDISREALARAEREDGARPASSYEELLETPGIEAMVVSTGAKFHADQVIAAAERGLNVFVEKPLCSTPEEVERILEVWKRRRVVIGVGHDDHSTNPVSRTIKRMIDDGSLGTVATFEATTAHSGGLVMKPGEWRADPAKNPGGMLFQCGVHKIHELLFYFGPIARVSAMMRYGVHTTPTAHIACCILQFESGLVGTLNAYHVTPYRHTLGVFGTRTNIYREDLFFDEGTKLWTQTTHLDGKKEPAVPLEVPGKEEGAPTGNVRSFHRAIVSGGTPYPSVVDGARAVAVVFAAEESSKAGRFVDVPRIG